MSKSKSISVGAEVYRYLSEEAERRGMTRRAVLTEYIRAFNAAAVPPDPRICIGYAVEESSRDSDG